MIKQRKSNYLTLMILFVLSLCFIPSVAVFAKANTPATEFIIDDLDLFTEEQEQTLNKKAKAIQDKYKVDVILITTDEVINSFVELYSENYYDEHYDRKKDISKDAVIIVRNGYRYVYISGYGKCETYVSNNRIEKILDDMTPLHRQDQFYEAFCVMYDSIRHYLGLNPNPLTWTWVQLLIALAIGAISVGIMLYNSGGKVTTNNRTYLDLEHSGLVSKRDIYLRTTVQKIHRPKSNNSSSRSSGGHSHSGGGRSM